jgi:hypothetical protein
VRAYCTALGSISGFCKLYLNPRNAGDHRIWTASEKREVRLVHCVALDDWGLDRLDALKLDTQGAEHLILEGAQKTIRSQKKLVLSTEFWPTGLKNLGSCERSFEALLRSLGFTDIYRNSEGRKTKLAPGALADLIDPYSYNFTNLLCFKGY